MELRPPLHLDVGRLSVSVGGVYHKTRLGWLPDGLHVWWGDRGVHAGWGKPKVGRRVEFVREPPASE